MASATITELIKRSFTEMMKDVGTSIPGYILAFDPDRQIAQVQIAIERIDRDGNSFTPPPLIECPVYFFGGSYAIDVQVDKGTEGVILFSQRCIDAWVNNGGVAKNPVLRFHDFSDAYFLPGLRSQPKKLPSFQNNGIRMRNNDGSKYIWLKNDGTAEITVTTLNINGNIVHVGDTTQTGDQTTSGTINADTSVTSPSIVADGKELAGHIHPAGTPPGDTGANKEPTP